MSENSENYAPEGGARITELPASDSEVEGSGEARYHAAPGDPDDARRQSPGPDPDDARRGSPSPGDPDDARSSPPPDPPL
jgi:hypothetical protein